jgi:L-lysine 6-transaminase
MQGEGGDGYFSPNFFRYLRKTADENGFLLMFDEVQTGWSTGSWWAHDHMTGGVRPDIFTFGKKVQQCGIATTARIDDTDNVFKVSSRINSTWGGTLADMVRSTKYIEVISKGKLHDSVAKRGEQVKKALLETDESFVTNIRGKGGWQAFTLPSTPARDALWKGVYKRGCLVLKSGEKSIRLRLNLALTEEEAQKGMGILLDAIGEASKNKI